MKKRIFSLILVLALCLTMIPAAKADPVSTPETELLTFGDLSNLPDAETLKSLAHSGITAEAVDAVISEPLKRASASVELLPRLNLAGQYRVVGSDVDLTFDYCFPSHMNLDFYVLVYQGEVDSGNLIAATSHGVTGDGSYHSYKTTWNTAGCATGKYTAVYLAATSGSTTEILEDTVSGYYVNLVSTAVPMTDFYFVNLETGEKITEVNLAKGFKGVVPITARFVPANTTYDRSFDYNSPDDFILITGNVGGLLYAQAKEYDILKLFTLYDAPNPYLRVSICADNRGHTFGENRLGEFDFPTCTSPGDGYHVCSKCGYAESVTMSALGHDFSVPSTILVEETETSFGTRLFKCVRCDETEERSYHTCPSSFNDMVPDSNWAHKSIDYCVNMGLMSGTSATTFSPKTAMSRAMLVTVLYRMDGAPGAGSTKFSDVPSGQWYSAAVSWAADKGIVSGVGEGKFNPNGNVTREQIATILYRYAAYKGYNTSRQDNLSGFADSGKVGTWFRDGMKWAVAEGLISGTTQNGKTYLSPQGDATREQVAAILMRFCENVAK